ncbi:MAG: trans-2-enoyl-CoA reductase family protein [Treponemataceae bacterium]|nr:trans-2-enoyl-CoA reductase family protein [Treponemataceae bacterium]
MIIKPMIRNNICLSSHPTGCRKAVQNQINYVTTHLAGGLSPIEAARRAPQGAPRLALVIGCSTGYGLASRIAAAFGYGAATVGISFEKAGSPTKPGTPGWYNNLAFDREAAQAGLVSQSLDGDAFSSEMKDRAIAAIKEVAQKAGIPAQVDLVVYSLASPVRTDPRDGTLYRSVIKPIGAPFSGKTLDMMTGKISIATAEPATEEEIAHTVKVMGGEDWELWIDALLAAGVLAPGARTVAYTYIGPELSWPIYKNGTIGKAKEHLEKTSHVLNDKLSRQVGGAAWVSVNKALVTRASAVIPIIPLYISCLFKVMKEKNLHEGCIEQLVRLYRDRLYTVEAARNASRVPVDGERRIRIDDWEMRDDVQAETKRRMEAATEENIFELADVEGYRHDFLEAHGFDVAGVDYEADVDPSGI